MKTTFLVVLFIGSVGSVWAAEFLSYSTAKNAKARGVALSLDYPAGWTARDSPRPGVVHEFRDPATGGRDALILVVPTVQPRKATAQEFRKTFEREDAQERIMSGARHRKKEFVEDLGYPCVALDYDLEMPQLAPAVVQVRNYILLVGDKMVQVQFYAVAPPAEDVRVARKEMMEHVMRSLKKG